MEENEENIVEDVELKVEELLFVVENFCVD